MANIRKQKLEDYVRDLISEQLPEHSGKPGQRLEKEDERRFNKPEVIKKNKNQQQ